MQSTLAQNSILNTFINLIIRKQRLSMGIVSFVVFIAAVGMYRLEIVNDYAAQLGINNPNLIAYESMTENFTSDDTIIIAIEPLSGELFSNEVLALIEEITERSWQIPYSIRVDSITNFQHVTVHGDELEVGYLFTDTSMMPVEQIAIRADIVLNEPSLRNILIDDSGKNASINITILRPEDNIRQATSEASEFVYKMLAEYQQLDEIVRFRLSGKVVQDRHLYMASDSDGAALFPIMFCIIGLILWFVFRSFSIIVVASISTGMAVIGPAGLIGWSAAPYTPEGIAALSMIIPLSTADNVHVLSNYFKGCGEHDQATAMRKSMELNALPIFITTVTTSIGFLSLNLVDSPPVRLIGNTVAMGMLFAFFSSLIVLPFLVVNFTRINLKSAMTREGSMEIFSEWIVSHHKVLSGSVVILAIVCSLGLSQLSFDQTNIESFRSDNPYRQDALWIDNNLTGIERLNFIVDSNEDGGVSRVNYLSNIEKFSDWLKLQPHVVSVNAFSDVSKRLNRDLNGGADDHYQLPKDNALSAQYVLFFQQSLPFGLDLNNQIDFALSASRVVVSTNSLSNQQLVAFEQRALHWLSENLNQKYSFRSSSASTMFAHQIDRNIMGMTKSLLATLFIVSLTLMITLRSWRLGIISLIPNILPGAMAFGLWSLFFGDVGLIVIMAFATTLGVIVDDTVHLLVKYKIGKHIAPTQFPVKAGIRYSFGRVAMACIATTLALSAGFMALAFSEFTPHADMGIMSAMAISLALLIDFFLLPTLLLKWDDENGTKLSNSR